MSPLRIIAIFALVVISGGVLWLGTGLWYTHQAVKHLRLLDLSSAATAATKAIPVARSFDTVTGHTIPDVLVWHYSLAVISDMPNAISATQASVSGSSSNLQLDWMTLAQRAQIIETALPKTWLIRRLYPEETRTAQTVLADFQTLYQTVLSGHHTFLLLFQNSHELRATGGFTGSFALIELTNGQLISLQAQDIYVPDGQFTGFVPAPPGVEEYLSSGKGMRLPDANWSPDFPTSAQNILRYFALGDEVDIDGVLAINLEVAGSIIDALGNFTVPDYQMTVTGQNLADVLRTGRENFFPGSIQKQHLLGSVLNQLKFKLAESTPAQQRELLTILSVAVTEKQIQAYATDLTLQSMFQHLEATGEVRPDTTFLWFPVESNVGINKANHGISREVELQLGETRSVAQITITNSNQDVPSSTQSASPHYANYQRLYLRPEVTVVSIMVDGQQITTWDEVQEMTAAGLPVKQVGWLLPVPAASQRHIEVVLNHPPLGDQPQVTIQKQSGISTIPYTVSYQGQSHQLLLTKDTVVEFKE